VSEPVLSTRAARDLEEIWEFIAQSHPLNADHFISELLDVTKRVAASPRIGRLRPALREGLRIFPHRNYLILYTVVADTVRILRIVHGSRSIAEILRQLDE
jgi:toxin ParE1/3/4